jgi:outer membrane protein OmpA-like peptidoglycan-associated protein
MVTRISFIAGCYWLLVNVAIAQDIEFESLNKLPSIVNSGCEEILPIATADSKTLYFVRVACTSNTGGATGGSDIWVTEYNPKAKEWSRPKNNGVVINDKGNNAVVGVSADGNTIYMMNTTSSKRIKGIYYSKKVNDKWTSPELEPIPFLETEEYFGVYVAPDMKTIIASMKRDDGNGEEDLYVSHKNVGEWSEPLHLGNAINTIGFEISPFLTPDGKRLYFSSNGHRGLGGADIFYSDRKDDTWTSWTTPVNLGNLVNSEGFDAYFSMNDSVAWFSSSDKGNSDLYRAKVKKAKDPAELAVNNIVEEATSMMADLTDDTYDSLASVRQSVFVSFEKNTSVLSAEAAKELDDAVALIRQRKHSKVKLIAYVNTYGGENGQLWDKRLEEIRNYLRQKTGIDLMIDTELVGADMSQSARGSSVVEVRYN